MQADRKLQLDSLVLAAARQDAEQMATEDYGSDNNMPFADLDDNDQAYVQSDLAYELWKARELKRLLRDRLAQEKAAQEQKEVERRRNMTEAERLEENAREHIGEKKQKVAYNFMQRYYHRGAFMPQSLSKEDEAVLDRDFNLPTGEDKMNKEALTKYYQKRTGKAGRKGQSKYTHLTDVDTTNFNPATKV